MKSSRHQPTTSTQGTAKRAEACAILSVGQVRTYMEARRYNLPPNALVDGSKLAPRLFHDRATRSTVLFIYHSRSNASSSPWLFPGLCIYSLNSRRWWSPTDESDFRRPTYPTHREPSDGCTSGLPTFSSGNFRMVPSSRPAGCARVWAPSRHYDYLGKRASVSVPALHARRT